MLNQSFFSLLWWSADDGHNDCAWDDIYILRFIEITESKGTLISPPLYWAEWNIAVKVICKLMLAHIQANIPDSLNHPLKHHPEFWTVMISSTMVNTRQKHFKCGFWRIMAFNKHWLKNHYQQYHLISMKNVLVPSRILLSLGLDWPEQLCFDFNRCTWMVINKLVN